MTLTVNGLSYERNKKLLFNQLSFEVSSGEALHIVGPNGAGKTSLLQILTGLISPLHGEILWKGVSILNSASFKKNLLYISHKLGMKSTLTPFENLYLFLLRRGVERVGQSFRQIKQCIRDNIVNALLTLDLASYSKTLTGLLSVGQQRRLLFAKLLLVRADCWILDEPFTALDIKGIHFVSLLIEEQLRVGGIVIFTSHQSFSLSKIAIKRFFLDGGSV
ncbi:MAG: heme ABC exporter ATP-binding protein CcmA [Pseudomonadota bacterium]